MKRVEQARLAEQKARLAAELAELTRSWPRLCLRRVPGAKAPRQNPRVERPKR